MQYAKATVPYGNKKYPEDRARQLIERIHEDNVLGKLTGERLMKLSRRL